MTQISPILSFSDPEANPGSHTAFSHQAPSFSWIWHHSSALLCLPGPKRFERVHTSCFAECTSVGAHLMWRHNLMVHQDILGWGCDVILSHLFSMVLTLIPWFRWFLSDFSTCKLTIFPLQLRCSLCKNSSSSSDFHPFASHPLRMF